MNQHVYLLFGVCLTAACGYTAPYQVSGTAASKEGVQISLAGERCYVNRSGEQIPTTVGDDVLHLEVSLQVANRATHPAQLSLDRFQLAEGTSSGQVVGTPQESGAVVLLPGESRTVALDFEKETALDCHHSFALEARDAVAIEGKHIEIEPVGFQPVR